MTRRHSAEYLAAAMLVTGAAWLMATAVGAVASQTPATPQTPATQPATAERQLEAAIHREQVLGDVKGAIEQYKVLAQSATRAVAAQALIHLGQCYEKLGEAQTREARATYERVVRDYADQAEVVARARARLAALAGPAAARGLVSRRVLADATGIDGAVSADGRYIRSLDWDTGDVVVLEVATGQKTRITNKGPWTENDATGTAAFSRDGKQIAYHAWSKEYFSLLRVRNLDGTGLRTLYAAKSVNEDGLVPLHWSPDGSAIMAYGDPGLVLISATDASIRVVTRDANAMLSYSMMCPSPDGRYLAFSLVKAGGSGHTDVVVMAVEDGAESLVAGHPAEDLPVAWTPDGMALVFISDRAGTWDLWRVALSGGRQAGAPELLKKDFGYHFTDVLGFAPDGSLYYRVLTAGGGLYSGAIDIDTGRIATAPALAAIRYMGLPSQPTYSPDGKSVLYLSRRGGVGPTANIITIRSADTGEERFLTPRLRFVNQLAWGPDGRSIIGIGITTGSESGIFRIDADTSAITKLRDSGFAPRICPDGKTLLFEKPGPIITKRNLDTGVETEIVKNRSLFYDPSPDCREIAYQDDGAVKVMSIDGGESRELFRGLAEYYRLRWTRDSRYIIAHALGPVAAKAASAIWRVPSQGGTPVRLDLSIAKMEAFGLHPDNRRFMFSVSEDAKSELWVLENFLPAARTVR